MHRVARRERGEAEQERLGALDVGQVDGVDVIAPVMSPPRRQGRPSEATVLVVDDDADVRSLMVRLIANEGLQ